MTATGGAGYVRDPDFPIPLGIHSHTRHWCFRLITNASSDSETVKIGPGVNRHYPFGVMSRGWLTRVSRYLCVVWVLAASRSPYVM